MSFPLHLPPQLAADIDAAMSAQPPAMTRSALLRRLLRAGLLAEGRALSEDRASVREREWPPTRLKRIPTCAYCPSQSQDGVDEWHCAMDPDEREVSSGTPPDWCPLRAGPVVLRLEVGNLGHATACPVLSTERPAPPSRPTRRSLP